MRRVALVCSGVLALSGCQSFEYQKIAPGPTLEYADAQCQIGAMSVEQGIIAYGTPSYVAGAQLGNAIGNSIRQAQFMKNCMTMQGWRQVPVKTSQKSAAAYSPKIASAASVAPGKFPGLPPAPTRMPMAN